MLVEEHIKTCNTCALAWGEKIQFDTSFDSEYTMLIGGLFGSLWWAIIYSALCVLGITIGFLLCFAFRKEAAYEKIS